MNPNSDVHSVTQNIKVIRYHRAKRILSLVELSLVTAYLIILLLTGLTFELDRFALAVGGGSATRVFIYFVVVMAILEVLTLPVTIISSFWIEKRFGLLNQSWKAWLVDLAKSQLIGLIFGVIAIETLYLSLRLAGGWWWLPAGAVFSIFFVFLAQLYPILILPIFYNFRKLPENTLSTRLNELCRRAGLTVMGIYEWGLAEKTRRANAALTGWGPTRRVVLADSLLFHFTPLEIEVIVAHELGHHRLNHLRWLLLFQCGVVFMAFGLADVIFRTVGPLCGLTSLSEPSGMPLMGLTFISVSLATLPFINLVNRSMEKQADQFALALTGLIGPFISAIERLTYLNLAEMNPPRWIEVLLYSHPAPIRRIQTAKEFMHRYMIRPEDVDAINKRLNLIVEQTRSAEQRQRGKNNAVH
jgi:STE24 endopeptidase